MFNLKTSLPDEDIIIDIPVESDNLGDEAEEESAEESPAHSAEEVFQ